MKSDYVNTKHKIHFYSAALWIVIWSFIFHIPIIFTCFLMVYIYYRPVITNQDLYEPQAERKSNKTQAILEDSLLFFKLLGFVWP